jgi:hypothetical protein
MSYAVLIALLEQEPKYPMPHYDLNGKEFYVKEEVDNYENNYHIIGQIRDEKLAISIAEREEIRRYSAIARKADDEKFKDKINRIIAIIITVATAVLFVIICF